MSLPPGRYMITANAPRWTLRSVMVGGRDVASQPLDLSGGDVSGLVVSFFDRPAMMTGIVRDSRGLPDPSALVVALSSDYRSLMDNAMNARGLRTVHTSADGRYTLTGLLPGDYLVAAVNENALSDASNPTTAIQTIAGTATRITIADNDRKTQDLLTTTIHVR
jgi:hypothetical protein